MATAGPTITGTGADDATVGTVAWTNPTNIQANDGNYATNVENGTGTFSDTSVKLVIGGSIVGSDLKTNTTISATEALINYGGASNTWGNTTISPIQVNANNFGAVYSVTYSTGPVVVHYIKGTNYGFTIPIGGAIQGITMGVSVKVVSASPCFVKGTSISTPNGQVLVENLRVGDTVLCFNKKGELKESKVLIAKHHQIHQTVEIKTTSTSAITTVWHKYFIEGNKFKMAKYLKLGDKVQVIKNGKLEIEEVLEISFKSDVREVYKVTVDKYHTYFGNNLASHNISIAIRTVSVNYMQITVTYLPNAGNFFIMMIKRLSPTWLVEWFFIKKQTRLVHL